MLCAPARHFFFWLRAGKALRAGAAGGALFATVLSISLSLKGGERGLGIGSLLIPGGRECNQRFARQRAAVWLPGWRSGRGGGRATNDWV